MPSQPTLSFPERFRNWYAYERDCNAKALAMLESVPAERREDPAFQRAVDKMAHLAAARENWLFRLGKWGREGAWFPTGLSLAELRARVGAIEGAWAAYLETVDEGALLREFEFTASNGDRWRWNVLDCLTQVFGHAWYHRGQIAMLVKDLGGKSVDSDYAFWCGTGVKLSSAAPGAGAARKG